MSIKKATYKVDNGTDYDEVMFKTTADQVVQDSSKRFVSDTEKSNWNTAKTRAEDWNRFKTNGGEIKATVTLKQLNIGDIIMRKNPSNTVKTDISSTTANTIELEVNKGSGKIANLQIDALSSSVRSSPFNQNSISLGTETVPWKDIFIGTSFKQENGYSKLPNGLILQWGSVMLSFGNRNYSQLDVTLPMSFPTSCITCISDCGENNVSWGVAEFITASTIISNEKISLYSTTRSAQQCEGSAKVRWIALGY